MEKMIYISPREFQKNLYERFVIVSDVGGTNTHVAIIGAKNNKEYSIVFKHYYLTKDISGFETVLNEALREAKELYDVEINIACIGAAGPISRKRDNVKLTNADLEINTTALINKTLLKKIILINDFEAIGYGLDMLDLEKDVIRLNHLGEDLTHGWTPSSTIAVIGAGTGLGMSIASYDIRTHLHVPLPSDGGHTDFAAHNLMEMELVHYLKKNVLAKRDAHPEFERVLSGRGMEHIFDFLCTKYPGTGITKKISKMQGVEKLREIEINYVQDEICRRTLDLFMRFYARAARNLALISECYSGLFITGRIALKHLEMFKKREFMEEFERHDKRSDVLRKIPVFIITNTDVSLYGCCNMATNYFNIF